MDWGDRDGSEFRRMLGLWEELRIYAGEYRELDDERVLVLINRSGRGKISRLELDELQTRGAVLYHVHDGKVTRLVNYYDRQRAFADLGLAPGAVSSGEGVRGGGAGYCPGDVAGERGAAAACN
jgi:hypothetical protein